MQSIPSTSLKAPTLSEILASSVKMINSDTLLLQLSVVQVDLFLQKTCFCKKYVKGQ